MEPMTKRLKTIRKAFPAVQAAAVAMLLAFWGATASAELLLQSPGTRPVQVRLLAAGRLPDGSVLVGIRFRMDNGWHIYWKNPGDAGMPVTVNWTLPEGWSAGPLLYPVPVRFTSQGLTGYGYRDEVILFSRILTDPRRPPAPDAVVGAEVSWLACGESCQPGSAVLELRYGQLLKPSDRDVPRFLERVPKPFDQGTLRIVHVSRQRTEAGNVVVFRFSAPLSGRVLDFFPDPHPPGVRAGEVTVRGSSLFIPFSGPPPLSIGGVLATREGGFSLSRSIPSRAGPDMLIFPEMLELLVMLALAFAGGMMLNVMPCVLPVLGLKVFGLIGHHGEDRGQGKRLSLVFAAGVVVSFWVLAGSVFALKSMGEQVGWGFQFQSPWFVAVMVLVVFAFALNLFGVYEFSAPVIRGPLGAIASHHDSAGAFVSGVLATTLATPCTAPFLGSALGFAFSQPAGMIFVFFTVIATGMALPYVMLAWHPSWLKLLPKPGEWMHRFKQVMGFVLLSVVVWLCAILARRSGADVLVSLLILLLFLSLLLWIAGIAAGCGASWKRRVLVWLALLLSLVAAFSVLLGGAFSRKAAAPSVRASDTGSSGIPWIIYTPDVYEAALASGKTVFLEVTADWCLTCKVLEATVLNQELIVRKLMDDGIVALKADWTTRDDAVGRLLNRFGRSGVPLLVIIPGGNPDRAIVLPEIVTVAMLASALDRARISGK
jgi:thiol:disulfide interchange protein DsbD